RSAPPAESGSRLAHCSSARAQTHALSSRSALGRHDVWPATAGVCTKPSLWTVPRGVALFELRRRAGGRRQDLRTTYRARDTPRRRVERSAPRATARGTARPPGLSTCTDRQGQRSARLAQLVGETVEQTLRQGAEPGSQGSKE